MTARFGRNKKRAARAAIEEVERRLELTKQVLESERRQLSWVNRQLAEAREDARQATAIALTEFVNRKEIIKSAMEMVSIEISRMFGKELLPIAQKLVASDRRHRGDFPGIEFKGESDVRSTPTTFISGTIPALNYNVVIEDLRLRI